MPHTHQYAIADDEAVDVLVDKVISHCWHQERREKLLKALDDASRHYNTAMEGIFPWVADRLRGRPKTLVAAPLPAEEPDKWRKAKAKALPIVAR
jgi:hypothetical protein